MPTSLRTPVVRPLRRWARKPRSGPLHRSSARPSAATAATAGPFVTPDLPADERQAQAVEVDSERSAGETVSRSCRARWTNPPRSRPVARWPSGSSTSRTRRPDAPRRSSSGPRSRTRPRAGRHAPVPPRRARAVPKAARAPRYPQRADQLPGDALREPEASPPRSANAATVRSPLGSQRLELARERSASQSSSAPGDAARSAADRAWPLPRRGRRSTTAPCFLRDVGGAVA